MIQVFFNWLRSILSDSSGDFGAAMIPPKPEDKKRSPKWDEKQKETVKNHPYCCVCGTKENLEVHHLIPYDWDASLELVDENLRVVCRLDHFNIGHDRNWKNANPNFDIDAAREKKRLGGVWFKEMEGADLGRMIALKRKLGIRT